MEKDPEDVRFNFVRWLNNDVGTAIGPSRVNPMTGQILNDDHILTDDSFVHIGVISTTSCHTWPRRDLLPKHFVAG